eukprot:Em0016g561a
MRCSDEIAPEFWSHFNSGMTADDALEAILNALEHVNESMTRSASTAKILEFLPVAPHRKGLTEKRYDTLRACLFLTVPDMFCGLMEGILYKALTEWGRSRAKCNGGGADEDEDEAEEDEGEKPEESEDSKMDAENPVAMDANSMEYWSKFLHMTELMRSLQLLHFFVEYPVVQVIMKWMEEVINEKCAKQFDTPLLHQTVSSVQETTLGWLQHVYGYSEAVGSQWLPQVEYFGYKTFAEMRIKELFEILVEFPDSKPSLDDLKDCLDRVELRATLIKSLRDIFQHRLLHPGANTSDIITQYISAIRALGILDHSGVVLEQVCDPVRTYLRTREDTVRCIVASLTDDSSNDLADELASGEPVLVDLNEESDGEEQDFDSWQPDPVDADPTKTSKSRRTSDIISLLVNIYGSREMFVNEYRNLLANRLLQSLNYDTCREVRNLELLKLRFGESNLQFCEVMVKDMVDSRRINSVVVTKMKTTEQPNADELELKAFILSHVFWPTFREEKLKLPAFMQQKLQEYQTAYQSLKGLRTLEWKPHLGTVDVDLVLADRELSFSVSPIRATIIYQFQQQSSWTVDAMSLAIESQPSIVRKHMGFWASQGVLKEHPLDTFTVVERQEESKQAQGEVDEEEESAMASAEEQKESELQVYWSYIFGMLTNLGSMPVERIHATLRMFAMQGPAGKEFTQVELKAFLDKKVKEQHLVCSGGAYQLPKAGH